MLWLLCLLAGVSGTGSDASTTWIDSSSYSSVQIVLTEMAPEAEKQAATLFQGTWRQCTGFEPPIGPAPQSHVNVWIGMSALPGDLEHLKPASDLGRDALLLKTFVHDGVPGLLIAGGADSGVLYAVYEFFEQRFGVRWLAPEVTHVPPAPKSIAAIDYTYTPPFFHREMGVHGEKDLYRLNSPFRFGLGGHSLYSLLPPEEYFAAHPEYYSEINGKRIAAIGIDWRNIELAGEHPGDFGQLCMSNPEVAKAIAAEIDEMAQKRPEANAWAVCQMDWGNNCQCAACKALDEQEGTPMGSLLTGVNRVAELVERSHPDFFVETYAYAYTRKPPKTIKPRRNVIVQLCDIECDFARPLTDPESPVNRAFVRDYKDWAALTRNILLYDYPINYWRFQLPHPILPVFGPNMAFYADQKAMGVFQLSMNPDNNSLGYLTLYMLGKLLWNPHADAEAVKNEFIELYYGPAAPQIKEFIALSERTLKESGIELSLYDTGGWITHAYLAASEDLFQRAFAASDSNEIRRRVDMAYLQVQFAALASRPELSFTDNSVILKRPPSISAEEYVKRLERFGIPEMGENQPRERVLTYYGGTLAARDLTCELVAIENEAYLLWVVPALKGSAIRFQDKRTKQELLRAHKDYGVFPGAWQDWVDRDTRAETAAAEEYRLIEHDNSHLVIEAATESGLVVRRTMQLSAGTGPLEVELSLGNPTNAPRPAKVKFHPEFYCPVPNAVPEIWLAKTTGWTHLNAQDMDKGSVGHGFLFPEGAKRWAFHLSQENLTLVNEFDPAAIEQLLYYYSTNRATQQINLELLPPRTLLLAPGETRAIKAAYWTSRERPADL